MNFVLLIFVPINTVVGDMFRQTEVKLSSSHNVEKSIIETNNTPSQDIHQRGRVF